MSLQTAVLWFCAIPLWILMVGSVLEAVIKAARGD